MARQSMGGITLKLERAQEHLYALDEAVRGFLSDPDSYDLVLDHSDRNRPKLIVVDTKAPPPELGVLIGECAYNLRSALDHLVFQLAIARYGRRRVPTGVEKASAFPIFKSGRRFNERTRNGAPMRGSGLACIAGTSDRAQAIVERLQPYHRRKNPRARALWQLHELCNRDKHRALPLTIAALAGSRWQLSSYGPMVLHSTESYLGPLKRNAAVASWHISPGPGPLKLNVEVEMVPDVLFQQGPSSPRSIRGQSVMRTLQNAMEFIADEVCPPLAAEMGLNSTFRAGLLLDFCQGDNPAGGHAGAVPLRIGGWPGGPSGAAPL